MLKLASRLIVAAVLLRVWIGGFASTRAADWPMQGRDGTRNGVSPELGAPTVWSVEAREGGRLIRETHGVRWTAQLGVSTFSSPVVANGLVWIGTCQMPAGEQNLNRRVGMLKCFRVADGKPVFEFLSPVLGGRPHDESWSGLGSSPLIEGERLWLATNRGEVHCLDIGPLIRGEGAPRELWKLDLIKTFEPFQRVALMGPPRPCSIGASWNGRIFVTINNGISADWISVPKPDAPSLVCLNKDTGEVHWTDNSPGPNILLTQFASPTVAEIAGHAQVIVPQSDGWIRAFDPASGAKLWEFDINLKTSLFTLNGRSTRNSLLGNAVIHDNRVYIASGMDAEQGEGAGRLVCIDPTKRGDISSELAINAEGKPLARRRLQAVDLKAGEKAIPNPRSGLIWEFVNCGKNFEDVMHRSMSSVVVSKGLVVAADAAGLVHCLDATTGQRHWSHDNFATIWASPLVVDDKVYVADEDGDVSVYGLSSDPDIAMKKDASIRAPLAEINLGNSVYGSPCFSNGTLYVANRNQLFAVTGEAAVESTTAVGGSWPQWRGPNRDNTSPETGLLKEWPEAGPPLVSRVDGLGEGIASVSIADGKIFTLGYFEAGEFLTALDQSTTQRLWMTRLGPKVNEQPLMRWLSQRSPTVDGDRVYAITSGGRLVCLSILNGRELWSKNYPNDFDAKRPGWGFCDYPLVDGDRLICTPGGPNASLVALDKRTGREIWRSAVPDGGISAFAALVALEVNGVRQYVAFLSKALVGVRATDGVPLWRYTNLSNGTANSHTPIVRGDQILSSNGYGTGLALLKLVSKGEEFEVQKQYSNQLSPDAFQDNGLVVGDHLFMSMGSALQCVDWKSGEKVWAARAGGGKMAITSADDRLYVRTSDGQVMLVDTSRKEHVIHGRFAIPEAVKGVGGTFPVIAGGRLYLRDDNKLLCYDVRAESLQKPRKDSLQIVLAPPPGGPLLNPRERILRSVFVPTPQDVVDKMLQVAAIKQTDVVYDLGSGDGRIVISAAAKYGCKGVGYELDKDLVEQSRSKAVAAGVTSLVTFENKDLFTADLSNVDVLTVFLLPQQLEKLLPQIEKMKPGSRLVSHQFEIPGIGPDTTLHHELIAEGTTHAVHLWTLPLPKLVRRIEWPGNHVYHTAFSPDGRLYLAGGDTGTLRVWQESDGRQLLELPVPIGLFTADGKQIVGHNDGKTIRVFDIGSGQEVRQWEANSVVVGLAVAPDGQQIVSTHSDNRLRLWELATGREVRQLEGHTQPASVVFSPDSKQVLSASTDKTIRLWNIETGQLVRTFSGLEHVAPIPDHDLIVKAFFVGDGKQVVGYAWSQDKSLLVWDMASGDVIRRISLGANFHKDASLSPDGRSILTGHEDRTLRLRDLSTGREIRRFEMAGVNVPRAVMFSPDGRFILAGSHRGWLDLWQLNK